MTKIKKFGLAKGIFYALGTSIRFQFKSLFIVTLQINLRHNISNKITGYQLQSLSTYEQINI